MKDTTILIVDDDSEVLATLSEIVKELKLDTLTATNGQEAINKIKMQKVDLIITDLMMPKMDGLELIRKSRLINSKIPIAVISAHGEVKNVIGALNLGAYNFVTKPFTIKEIEAVIKKGLRLRELSLSTSALLEGIRHYTEIDILSNPHLLPSVTLYIIKECQWRGIEDEALLSNISLCMDEMLSNALMHGNELDETRKISIKLTFDSEKFSITVADEGRGFDHQQLVAALAEPGTQMPTKRGLFIVKHLMDELSFNATGSQVTLTKYLDAGGKRVLH